MRKAIFILVLFSSVFISRADVYSYNNQTTHPAITDEAADFYNLNFGNRLTSEEKEWLVSGSILEDTEPRYINHFYDPVYNTGWSGENAVLPRGVMQKITDIGVSPVGAVSAKNWAQNQGLQEKYKLYQGNRTWQKVIYEYVKNGNKKEAFLALGFVLHLLQDMTVAEHTRNDTHTPADESPYEKYANQYNRNNFNVAEEFKNKNYRPVILNTLDDYFNYAANYSNNYFFSKDTINDEKYNRPIITKEENGFAYGLDKNAENFMLARVDYVILSNYEIRKEYSFLGDSSYYPILSAYFSRLSREAVLTSAGVIDLFFREVERAEKDPSLLESPPIASAIILSVWGEVSRISRGAVFAYDSAKNFAADIYSGALNLFSSSDLPPGGGPAGLAVNNIGDNLPVVRLPEAPETENSSPEAAVPPVLQPSPTPTVSTSAKFPVKPTVVPPPEVPKQEQTPGFLSLISAPFGAGGGGGSQTTNNESQAALVPSEAEEEPVLIPTPEPTPAPTPAPAPIPEPEPIPTPEPTPPPDIIPPEVSFSVSECENSVSEDGCLLLSGETVSLFWESRDEDLDFFELAVNGEIFATTSTSTVISLPDNFLNNLSLRAKDIANNWSEAKNISVEISSMPVVINEIAWAGTGPASSQDEWIELYNRADRPINLNNWILHSKTDGGPYLNLSGVIPPRGYYLIERTDDNTISDIPADFIGSFGNGLNNAGEVLVLSYASTTIDETSLCGYGPVGWCPGFDYKYRSMERINADVSGKEWTNWSYNNQLMRNGKDSAGQEISATPKSRNSANYSVSVGTTISADLVLVKSRSPYIVNNTWLTVQSGAVLTIEPGVVIKFYNDAGLIVRGKIIAEGAAGEPIIFTSFYDDEYGGDLNKDATTTLPNPGDWFGVTLAQGSSADSVFKNIVFRYAGKYYYGSFTDRAQLSVYNAPVSISDSVFEYGKVEGVKLTDSSATIQNCSFNYMNKENFSTGLLVFGGAPEIKDNEFIGNTVGLDIRDSAAAVIANDFKNNTREAFVSYGKIGAFENNSGNGNGVDGISINGNLTVAGDDRVLKPNDLPYIVSGATTISADSVLRVLKGVKVLGNNGALNISGTLLIEGEAPGDILFSSVFENPQPGDWRGFNVNSGGSLVGRGFTFNFAGGIKGGALSDTLGIVANNANVEISNAIISDNYYNGLTLANSYSKIEDTIFQNHLKPGSAAIEYQNSPINLKNITFQNNWLAVSADANSLIETAENIIFENNTSTTSPSNLW